MDRRHLTTLMLYGGEMKYGDCCCSPSPSELADALRDLRYDILALYLVELADALQRDSVKDHRRGRVHLAMALSDAAMYVSTAAKQVEGAWEICRRQPEYKKSKR